MMTSTDAPDQPVTTSGGDVCVVSKAVLLVKHHNTSVLDHGVKETKSETQPYVTAHPVNREQSTSPTVVDDVTTATRLCEILLSRGLGDPTLTPTPPKTSSGPTANRRRYHTLPPPSTDLVRSVERVQTIPYLVAEIRRSAVGHAEDARRRTAKFIERIEDEQRKARAMAATAHLKLLAQIPEAGPNSVKSEVIEVIPP